MLAVSSFSCNNDGVKREGGNDHMHHATMGMGPSFSMDDEFPDFSGGNLLDSIDFDDLFLGMHGDDVLPDLEMDPELLAEFSLSGGEESDNNNSSSVENVNPNYGNDGNLVVSDYDEVDKMEKNMEGGEREKVSREEEIESKEKEHESDSTTTTVNSSSKERDQGGKKHGSSNNRNNNNQGKRKTKVDWTPELHRRFVQAVEQLGVDKAVPSRILEIMGIDCLTRHNIASHLQKYRSHRKHLLAREAEAASWTQKRQMYGVAVGGAKGGGANISPWHPPTMGFPPMTPVHHHPHHFRPLHVWGHPPMDLQSRMPMWPKQVVPSPSPPPPAWAPHHPPPADPSFWHPPHQRVPNGMTPAAPAPSPCFTQPLPATRFTAPLVPGIPPHAMYRPEHAGAPPPPTQAVQPGFEAHPSKESIDAALGDVLAKPWLPLPIGLKPPSTDSVLVELQRQGVPKIPPSCA